MIIEAQHFLIATGSVPRQMAKLQLDGEYIVTPQQASLPCLLATP
jgi:pyruvate/2-oxoglutarate dehydrogenase complex dihydrolipoamide dehydrogenase (E3) component